MSEFLRGLSRSPGAPQNCAAHQATLYAYPTRIAFPPATYGRSADVLPRLNSRADTLHAGTRKASAIQNVLLLRARNPLEHQIIKFQSRTNGHTLQQQTGVFFYLFLHPTRNFFHFFFQFVSGSPFSGLQTVVHDPSSWCRRAIHGEKKWKRWKSVK